jgi:hypothetical protein
MKTLPFAFNPDTCEVYARTPGKEWKTALEAWIKARRARKCECHATLLPSPMPYGHIMFRDRKGNHYQPMPEAPAPVWTDGIGCLYAGQRVSWQEGGGYSGWHYAKVVSGADNGVYVNEDGKELWLDPLALS